jgi:RHS repeat-associated protein
MRVSAGHGPVDPASYTVDAAGNRTAKTDQATAVTSNYTYDAIYQLLQATQAGNTTESYTYDPVGNRLSSLGVSPYAYNSSNELTSTPNATYTYDNNGNTVTKTDSTGTTQYAWDYENRLTSVTLPGSGGTVNFKYDPFGRRIEKITPSGTSIYAYDGDNLIEETDGNGAVVARYTDTLNIDEPLAMLRAGATSFYEQDGLGSVTSLTNAAGAVAETYTYDAFGKLTASSGSITNPFRYTGREFDSTTGLYYYRARYRDPYIGRFVSEDPIRLSSGDVNFYVYVWNNPNRYRDASGKGPTGVGVIVGGAVGLVYGGLGALAESRDAHAVVAGALAGAAVGALAGAFSPDEGILTSALIGGAAAAVGDVVAQEMNNPCGFNCRHVIAAGIGGLIGGATEGLMSTAGEGAAASVGNKALGDLGKNVAGSSIGMPVGAIAAVGTQGAGSDDHSCGCSVH